MKDQIRDTSDGLAAMTVSFIAEVWRYPGDNAWHFVTLPVEFADEIREVAGDPGRGFGSVKVVARIGTSKWSTSVFPDRRSGSYVLPVKKAVRLAEGLDDGIDAEVSLELGQSQH